MKKLMRFLKDEDGATAVEYGIMVALIAVVIIAAVRTLGESTRDTFTAVSTEMGGVTPTP
jgi:pilus assembly protein Flp/PilA